MVLTYLYNFSVLQPVFSPSLHFLQTDSSNEWFLPQASCKPINKSRVINFGDRRHPHNPQLTFSILEWARNRRKDKSKIRYLHNTCACAMVIKKNTPFPRILLLHEANNSGRLKHTIQMCDIRSFTFIAVSYVLYLLFSLVTASNCWWPARNLSSMAPTSSASFLSRWRVYVLQRNVSIRSLSCNQRVKRAFTRTEESARVAMVMVMGGSYKPL